MNRKQKQKVYTVYEEVWPNQQRFVLLTECKESERNGNLLENDI